MLMVIGIFLVIICVFLYKEWQKGEFIIGMWSVGITLFVMFVLPPIVKFCRLMWRLMTSTMGLVIMGVIVVSSIIIMIKTYNRWGPKCAICHRTMPLNGMLFLKDGKVCNVCRNSVGFDHSAATVELAKDITVAKMILMQENQILIDPTAKLQAKKAAEKKQAQAQYQRYHEIKDYFKDNATLRAGDLYISDTRRQIFLDISMDQEKYEVYKYEELVDFELKQTHVIQHIHEDGATTVVNGIWYTISDSDREISEISEIYLNMTFSGQNTKTRVFLDHTIPADSIDCQHALKKAEKYERVLQHVKDQPRKSPAKITFTVTSGK